MRPEDLSDAVLALAQLKDRADPEGADFKRLDLTLL